jgi:pimeloyl-ACP methyl ester carboxylesterase
MHSVHELVQVPVDQAALDADVDVPAEARGLVVFVHGSGSSRFSPRNVSVARELQRARLGTVLVDLLTSEEEQRDLVDAHLRFDIDFLAARVVTITDWLVDHEPTAGLGLGLFGASTGGAAALVAAAERPISVEAVVSRGGRPDLAAPVLAQVHQPTLLIVGERDELVLRLNQLAFEDLPPESALEIVPGATHLFEEPGALERVASLAQAWFSRWLHRVPPGHQIEDGLAGDADN